MVRRPRNRVVCGVVCRVVCERVFYESRFVRKVVCERSCELKKQIAVDCSIKVNMHGYWKRLVERKKFGK